jgi:hypothetical protein
MNVSPEKGKKRTLLQKWFKPIVHLILGVSLGRCELLSIMMSVLIKAGFYAKNINLFSVCFLITIKIVCVDWTADQ